MQAEAAVALIVCTDQVLLLRRCSHPRDPWSDHWALPGGRHEPDDADLFATACRETAEEVGVRLGDAELVEPLQSRLAGRYVGRSLMVQPFHFRLAQRPDLRPEPGEVAELRWLDLDCLRDPAAHCYGTHTLFHGRAMGYTAVDGHPLWGFTYRLLCDWLGVTPR